MRNRINIAEIPGISPTIKDYLNLGESLTPYYKRTLSFDNLVIQAKDKLSSFSYRSELSEELYNQHKNLDLSDKQKENLFKISQDYTVTITTGHQLNLMSGPLYFIYKILHVIKLCDVMNRDQKDYHFVPIYWMATEDHDFKEINHFYVQNKKYEWKGEHTDFVGELPTQELKSVLSEYYESLKYFPKGKELRSIIEQSYFSQSNLSDATRFLVHKLFKEYGLLIIDGNSKNLKKLFIPWVVKDIKEQKSYQIISDTIKLLKPLYKIQVNPRKINFFYHENKERHRIDETNGKYYILGTCNNFSQKEILNQLNENPQKFSPNALMRPVYQEVILPNVAYIGGNAEISYWLELKKYFDNQKIPFPILIPRNSFLLINESQERKMDIYNWKGKRLFLPKKDIIDSVVQQKSDFKFDFLSYKERIQNIFSDLLKESEHTDPSWKNMILAQQKKQLNGLNKINTRFYKAERIKNHELISNFENLHLEIFPHSTWQERIENFSYYYSIYGKKFFNYLYNEISEFESVMNIITI